MSLKCRRYLTDAGRISRVVTTPSSFPSPATVIAVGYTRGTVQSKTMKGNDVIGLRVP